MTNCPNPRCEGGYVYAPVRSVFPACDGRGHLEGEGANRKAFFAGRIVAADLTSKMGRDYNSPLARWPYEVDGGDAP